MLLRKMMPHLALLASLTLVGFAQDKDEEGFVALFNGKDLSGFKLILHGEKSNEETRTFTVEEGILTVSGTPGGYLCTEKIYKNYVMRFDWKFLKDGGTGFLVHITGEHKVWPQCIEISSNGFMFSLGSGGRFTKDREAQKNAIKENDWNTTEIISKDGTVICKVNGIQISTGKTPLTEGHVGWQSEGAKLQLKNIRVKAE